MRQVRRYEHQIIARVVSNRVADVALATAVHREGEFVLRMVMPFERYAGELAVVDPDGAPGIHRDMFVRWFHGKKRKEIVWIVSPLPRTWS